MFSITTNRVRDAVKVTEGTESMILRVDFDPMAFVRVLETAKAKLAAVTTARRRSCRRRGTLPPRSLAGSRPGGCWTSTAGTARP